MTKFLYRLFRSFIKKVKVVCVIDGDTFLVMDRHGNKFKVRLWGVDAPELTQKEGAASKEFAKNYLQNKWVKLKQKDTDRYNRQVCQVYIQGIDFAKLSLKQKHCFVLPIAPISYKIIAWLNPMFFKTKPWTHRKHHK